MRCFPHALRPLLLAGAVATACAPALAQRAGDLVVGAGILNYAPQDKSQPIRFTEPVEREIPGSGSALHSAATLGLNAHYFLTDHWAIEGVVGIPPRVQLTGAGSLAALGELGNTRLYSPTVLAKYFFGQPTDGFRLSVGAGLAYARFGRTHMSTSLQNAVGGLLGIPPGGSTTSAKVDDRFGPVLNVGANYAIDDRWGVTLSVSYIRMKTTAHLRTDAGGRTVARSHANLRLDPIVPFLYVTYRY